MAAATVESSYYGVDAAGFVKKVAFGATILPFEVTIATTSLDDVGDIVKLVPLSARGGRNRLIAVVFYTDVEMDTGGNTLDADLTVYQNGAHTVIYNAATAFSAAVGTATAPLIILPFTALDDTEDDYEADLCFYVNVAANAAQAGTIKGLAIYE